MVGEEQLIVPGLRIRHQVLPRVQLKEVINGFTVRVRPRFGVLIKNDLVNGNELGLNPGQLGGVGDKPHVIVVLLVGVNTLVHVRKVKLRGGLSREDLPPPFGKRLPYLAPVPVALRVKTLLLIPGFLADGCLNNAGGGVCIVFEQFQGVPGDTGVCEIEPAVKIGVLLVPRLNSQLKRRFG